MACKNCEEQWRLILAKQSNNNYIYMKPKEEKKEGDDQVVTSEAVENVQSFESSEAPKNIVVPPVGRPDVNKIIEDRRKAIASGKIINK